MSELSEDRGGTAGQVLRHVIQGVLLGLVLFAVSFLVQLYF